MFAFSTRRATTVGHLSWWRIQTHTRTVIFTHTRTRLKIYVFRKRHLTDFCARPSWHKRHRQLALMPVSLSPSLSLPFSFSLCLHSTLAAASGCPSSCLLRPQRQRASKYANKLLITPECNPNTEKITTRLSVSVSASVSAGVCASLSVFLFIIQILRHNKQKCLKLCNTAHAAHTDTHTHTLPNTHTILSWVSHKLCKFNFTPRIYQQYISAISTWKHFYGRAKSTTKL